MRLLVINPNTSKEMTESIRKTIDRCKDKRADVSVVMSDFGAPSLESFYDYHLASFGCFRLLKDRDKEYDGILIACFGDPGLYALKEISESTVIGMAEASIAMSTLMGQKFGLLVASEKAVPMMKDMVHQYSFDDRLASIETIGLNVLQLEADRALSIQKLTEAGKKSIDHGADVLILGCAGMTGFKNEIEKSLGVPVIDPLECGYKVLEMMVQSNFPISKKGLYKAPYEKEILKSELLMNEV